ncbi:hypothetical protein Hanom_Chr17g01538381 [Helianthus anomalus]
MSFFLNVSKSCTLCSLGQTQLIFFVNSDHVQGTYGHFCNFVFLEIYAINLK